MQWPQFRARTLDRRARARRAASGSLDGLLDGWRFTRDPALTARVLEAWRSVPEPSPVERRVAGAVLPDSGPDLPERQLRALLAEGALGEPVEPVDPWVTRLDHLAFLGDELERLEREAWRTPRGADAADARVEGLWLRWATGHPWSDRDAWERLLRRPVRAAFRQVLASVGTSSDAVRRAVADADEALFYKLIGGGDGMSGLVDIGTRVVEQGGGLGPIPALAAVTAAQTPLVASCVSRRGHWPATLATLLPAAAGPQERAVALAERAQASSFEDWLDAHVALRLTANLDGPRHDFLDRDWAVVVQNRARARARLRAVLANRSPLEWIDAVVGHIGLAAHTRSAASRWAWAWAWDAVAHGREIDAMGAVTPPCTDTPGVTPLDEDQQELVRTWVLLVVLRGRGERLRTWVRTGGTGANDGVFSRLLGELPAEVTDADGGSRRRYTRVRGWLTRALPAVLRDWDALIAEVARLRPGRSLKRDFHAAVDPSWHPAVRRPRAGFPSFRREALAWLEARHA